MALHEAFTFLNSARRDVRLQEELEAAGAALTNDALVAAGRAEGLNFTVDELQAAFRHDWAMRQLRFNRTAKDPTGRVVEALSEGSFQ